MSKYTLAGGEALAKAVEKVYTEGGADYYLEPLNLWEDGAPVGTVKPGDGVLFCCRRGEREEGDEREKPGESCVHGGGLRDGKESRKRRRFAAFLVAKYRATRAGTQRKK